MLTIELVIFRNFLDTSEHCENVSSRPPVQMQNGEADRGPEMIHQKVND
jgi:hypothetical protein